MRREDVEDVLNVLPILHIPASSAIPGGGTY